MFKHVVNNSNLTNIGTVGDYWSKAGARNKISATRYRNLKTGAYRLVLLERVPK